MILAHSCPFSTSRSGGAADEAERSRAVYSVPYPGLVPTSPPQAFFGACTSKLGRVVIPLTGLSVLDRVRGLPGMFHRSGRGAQGVSVARSCNSALLERERRKPGVSDLARMLLSLVRGCATFGAYLGCDNIRTVAGTLTSDRPHPFSKPKNRAAQPLRWFSKPIDVCALPQIHFSLGRVGLVALIQRRQVARQFGLPFPGPASHAANSGSDLAYHGAHATHLASYPQEARAGTNGQWSGGGA